MSPNDSMETSHLHQASDNNNFKEHVRLTEDNLPTSLKNDNYNSSQGSIDVRSSSKLGNNAGKKVSPILFWTLFPINLTSELKAEVNNGISSNFIELNPMDKLLAKLSEQQATLSKQHETLMSSDDSSIYSHKIECTADSKSLPITPALSEIYNGVTTNNYSIGVGEDRQTPNLEELSRLKSELEVAKGKIARMDQELAQSRITKHSLDQVIGSTSETYYPLHNSLESSPSKFKPPNTGHISLQRENSWTTQDDCRSDTSETLSENSFNRSRNIWGNISKPANGVSQVGSHHFQQSLTSHDRPHYVNRGFGRTFLGSSVDYPNCQMNGFRIDRVPSESSISADRAASRRAPVDGRLNSRNSAFFQYSGANNSFDAFSSNTGNYTPVSNIAGPVGLGTSMNINSSINSNMNSDMGIYSSYQPQPIGTPLSPHAPEFTSSNSSGWKADTVATEGSTYLPTIEPLNYRRLLDRSVNCNWKYIVDKIVCNNDQQASIFLQQKLKVGTPEQKYDIVEAIVSQAYPLMVNRFGNFLVQRCFEHGTPAQVIKIAEAIRGQTLNLSMDAFGCHVVQKAFDSVPEDYKAVMVHELLRRIPETVIHRYACHVWQKLFELRWTESPPQIMKYVNDALQGMWHEVALGETGSLVVQNIFENCLEQDKRPCIEEVLASIDIISHGQFGNWCIQHICEHGAPADRNRAIDHVIRFASEYSMDQFASKVVEKCLKIGGPEFLGRYLDRVCEGRLDRPRIPLIDIASDQYGNYLIQYILTHSNPQHREIVAQHIRKHMVSLRGSKFGSRVGMLCTNPAIQTRPGPGVGPNAGAPQTRPGLGPQQSARYAGAYR
ncbi:RNA binding protein [Blumeria hordei DH14]|uniref:RNA binding protein n=1 Tax=Blumeria graminis f. sp. hordei (strain DH14) TaxID=546991 RepID=N1JG21_BLUG1|nr:RNA binding protein [Blumeria hordei DH14]